MIGWLCVILVALPAAYFIILCLVDTSGPSRGNSHSPHGTRPQPRERRK